MTKSNGVSYRGDFVDGLLHGMGWYIGEHKKGDKDGHGVFLWTNNRVKYGTWKKDNSQSIQYFEGATGDKFLCWYDAEGATTKKACLNEFVTQEKP